MKILLFILPILCITLLMSSCAGTYHAAHPQSLPYGYSPKRDTPVQLGYYHNVLSERKNKKFARKEEKKHIRLIAVQLTNNTDDTLTFGKDMLLFSGNTPVAPMDKMVTYKSLKQQAPLFLLYLLLTPTEFNITKADNGIVTEQESYPIGYVLGPGIAIGNMLVADANNKRFLLDLTTYDLTDREIAPGETVYGLIGISYSSLGSLEIRTTSTTTKAVPADTTDEYYKEEN